MNIEFVETQAGAFAQRLLAVPARSARERVEAAFVEAYGRPATELEVEDSLAFLSLMRSSAPSGEEDIYAWSRLCHVMLGASEFIYLE